MAALRAQGVPPDDPGFRHLKLQLYYVQQRAYPNDAIDWTAFGRAMQHAAQMPPAIIKGFPTAASVAPAAGGGRAFGAAGNPALGPQAGGAGRLEPLGLTPGALGGGPGSSGLRPAPFTGGLLDTGSGALAASSIASPLSSGSTARWSFIGPNNLMPQSAFVEFGPGPVAGRVNALAYDPTNTSIIYAAAAGGGLWKTTDGGSTWAALTDFVALPVSSVAVDPANHNNVYVGTGDFDLGVGAPMGLLKSTDGGATWLQVNGSYNIGPAALLQTYVSKVLVDPDNSQIITLTTGRGSTYYDSVWRSTDGGSTWTSVLIKDANGNQFSAAWCDVQAGALNSTTGVRYYYASCYDTSYYRDVYRSADRGATWTQVARWGPYPPSTKFDSDKVDAAPSPTNPDVVYAVDGAGHQIYSSANDGSTWTNITSNFPPLLDDSDNWGQPWYDLYIEAARNPQTGYDQLFVGLLDVVTSTDGGASWQHFTNTGDPTNIDLTHGDQHAFTANPQNASELILGSDGGMYKATFSSSTASWSFANDNAGLKITQLYDLSTDPSDLTRMVASAQDNGTPAVTGSLSAWTAVTGADGVGCAYDPTDPLYQYAVIDQDNDFYYTQSSWSSSSHTGPVEGILYDPNAAFVAPLTMDPNNATVLYSADHQLYRWDGTGAWSQVNVQNLAPDTTDAGQVLAIAVASGDSNRIYTGSNHGDLWMSTDRGSTWTQINGGTTPLPNKAITSIAVQPGNENSILVGLSGTGTDHVWSCANTLAGSSLTWTDVSGSGTTALPNSPVDTICLDTTSDPTTAYYVGTDIGVFYTSNAGGAWGKASSPLGLPDMEVNRLHLQSGAHYLYAATFGRGIWRLPLSPPAPSLVSATPGASQVVLGWNAPTGGADTYNIKRATTSGGPYTTVATGVASTTYTDTYVPNGTQYYVVSAVRAGMEGPNSNELAATPQPTWLPTDLTTGGDNLTRLLWRHDSNGHFQLWQLDTNATTYSQTLQDTNEYYTSGVTVNTIRTGGDGYTHVFLPYNSNTYDFVTWSVNTSTGAIVCQTSAYTGTGDTLSSYAAGPSGYINWVGHTTSNTFLVSDTTLNSSCAGGAYYQNGLYTPPSGSYGPTGASFGADFQVRLLLPRPSDQYDAYADVWVVNPPVGLQSRWTMENADKTYSALGIATGSDNVTRALWSNTNNAIQVWQINTSTGVLVSLWTYTPDAGSTAKAISVGGDGKVHILFTYTNGYAELWQLNATSGAVETIWRYPGPAGS